MSRACSRRACDGFSLLEVLVAFSILALSLGVIMHVLSSSLRGLSLGDAYARALAVAESKLASVDGRSVLREGIGESAGPSRYSWRITTSIPDWWEERSTTVGNLRPYRVEVTVYWRAIGGAKRHVSLRTLRLKEAP